MHVITVHSTHQQGCTSQSTRRDACTESFATLHPCLSESKMLERENGSEDIPNMGYILDRAQSATKLAPLFADLGMQSICAEVNSLHNSLIWFIVGEILHGHSFFCTLIAL